jgi:tetratricopeptide (TPR) repeat protein
MMTRIIFTGGVLIILASLLLAQERVVTEEPMSDISEQTVMRSASEDFHSLFMALKTKPHSMKLGNRLRQYCREKKELERCIDTFKELLKEHPEQNAIRYNAALAYVDKLPGHSLIKQGRLSSRSIELVSTIIEKNPSDWLAFYIRGMNQLYWPSWFRRTDDAIRDFEQCVEISETLPPDQIRPYHALAYIGLGDALVKAGKIQKAREVWQRGLKIDPSESQLETRLHKTDQQLGDYIAGVRDRDIPVDTDLSFLWRSKSSLYKIRLVSGHLYGPGPLPDQELAQGQLKALNLVSFLKATIEPFNNLEKVPNVPGEIRQGKIIDGRLSDGTLINESIDVGHVMLMNGKFDLLLAAVYGGPNEGKIHFFPDADWNWTIQDDIAIDPGFPNGVIKMNDFIFTTGPRQIPFSTQTARGYPGGVDRSGSLRVGQVVLGRLGDDNLDGYLDGVFNAIGSFPLNSIFLPGAPFAQTRTFESDIPITARDAAFLTTAGARNYMKKALELANDPQLIDEVKMLTTEASSRLHIAERHIERVLDNGTPFYSDELKVVKDRVHLLSQELKSDISTEKLGDDTQKLEQMLTTLLNIRNTETRG